MGNDSTDPPESSNAKKRKIYHVLYSCNPQTSNIHNVTTHNRFQLLENTEDSMDVDFLNQPSPGYEASKTPLTPKSAARIPPITITGHTKIQVNDLCTALQITEYHIKHISTGINVYCKSADDFTKLRNELKKESKPYYTHDIASDKEFKVVVKGLMDTDENDLLPELAKNKIVPTNIRQIVPKKQRYAGQVLYVLTFPINQVKMAILRQCKYLCLIKVEWDHYIPKKYGPTRCHNCQRFGHGSRNCGLPTRCAVCAADHSIEVCPMVGEDGHLKADCTTKCANCGANHVSSFTKCPKYIEYEAIQRSLNLKNSARNHPRQIPTVPQLSPSERQHLVNNRRNFEQFRQNAAQTGPMSYSAAVSGNFLPSNNLLPNDVLIQVTLEMIPLLRNCKTVEDQLRVVLTIASKFAHDGSK